MDKIKNMLKTYIIVIRVGLLSVCNKAIVKEAFLTDPPLGKIIGINIPVMTYFEHFYNGVDHGVEKFAAEVITHLKKNTEENKLFMAILLYPITGKSTIISELIKKIETTNILEKFGKFFTKLSIKHAFLNYVFAISEVVNIDLDDLDTNIMFDSLFIYQQMLVSEFFSLILKQKIILINGSSTFQISKNDKKKLIQILRKMTLL